MANNNLGKRLKEQRKAKRLNLRQLSDMSGFHMSYLGRIERGERCPSARVLRALAKPLGFTEVELLKLAGFMSRDDSDERIEKLKKELKTEIAHAFDTLCRKVDGL